MLVGKMDPKWGHIWTMLALFCCSKLVACTEWPKAHFIKDPEGYEDDLHDPPGPPDRTHPSQSPVFPRSAPPPVQRLLLGHCERLLHLDFATIVDEDVFQRLVAAVGLCPLDLPHYFLEGEAEAGGQAWTLNCSKLPPYEKQRRQPLLYIRNSSTWCHWCYMVTAKHAPMHDRPDQCSIIALLTRRL